MTGYGRGFGERGGRRVAVEIRSVNHRFLDIKLRGAPIDPSVEEKLQARIRASVRRGSLAVSVRIDGGGGQSPLAVDVQAARRIHTDLVTLARTLGIDDAVSLSTLIDQPGVLVAEDSSADLTALGEATLEAADAALGQLVEMRESEGSTLKGDITERLGRLEQVAIELEGLAREAPASAQRRLEERVARLLKGSNVDVDESRVAQEVALLADRLDVTEELVRVRSHIGQLKILLDSGEEMGRRLDFLVQELGREFNTVTSKSQSADIARIVVDAKAELEKIREQVQNIE